jgi:hypothetical protein
LKHFLEGGLPGRKFNAESLIEFGVGEDGVEGARGVGAIVPGEDRR